MRRRFPFRSCPPTAPIRWLRRGVVSAIVMLVTAWMAMHFVPLPARLLAPPPPATSFEDCQGRPLRTVTQADGFDRPVPYEGLPRALVEATLAAEDRRFWDHHGIDWRASTRALIDWVRHRRVVSGGSTITQQVIKLCEPRPRTVPTKLKEAVQAWRLEQLWDKPRILAAYVNRLDYGNLCLGPAEAARFYFGKPLAEITVPEAAFLAGLPQAPGRLNPVRHPDRARKRQQWILGQMARNGFLSESEAAQFRNTPLTFAPPTRPFAAPHFVDLVIARAAATGTPLPSGPCRTTLNLEWNRFAEQTLRHQLGRLRHEQVQDGAVVVIENASGAVRALVGSGDFFAPGAGQVNGAWARRSPGSTLKPFTYLLAFERGDTPATVVADVPAEFPTPTGSFQPVNYNRQCLGPVRYRIALANSLNIPAVRVLDRLGGPAPLQRRLQDCGLTTLDRDPDHYGLGLTIGNAEVRLLELANAYAALARLGEFRPYRLRLDPAAEETVREAKRVAPAGAAWLIADVLADNEARALAFGPDSDLRFDFPVACKTGTSSDFRDNWAIGYTPKFTVGVWVGNFDGTPMHEVSGVTGAAPILHAVVEFLHDRVGTSWYAPPPGLQSCGVDPLTGHRLEISDPRAVTERFLASTLPPAAAPEDYDARGRVRLGAEYANWAASADNLIANRVVVDRARDAAGLRLVTPLPGAVFFLDPDLPDSSQWLPLRAEGATNLTWSSDTLALRQEPRGTAARLIEGRHRIVVEAAATGARVETWITVRRL